MGVGLTRIGLPYRGLDLIRVVMLPLLGLSGVLRVRDLR
jgi:hypothetical protein